MAEAIRGRRRRVVYLALERLTLLQGRPPCRHELTAFIDEDWATSSEIGRALARLERDGYASNIGGGHYILILTEDGQRVEYRCSVGGRYSFPGVQSHLDRVRD